MKELSPIRLQYIHVPDTYTKCKYNKFSHIKFVIIIYIQTSFSKVTIHTDTNIIFVKSSNKIHM
jgi:hypothetical protein